MKSATRGVLFGVLCVALFVMFVCLFSFLSRTFPEQKVNSPQSKVVERLSDNDTKTNIGVTYSGKLGISIGPGMVMTFDGRLEPGF